MSSLILPNSFLDCLSALLNPFYWPQRKLLFQDFMVEFTFGTRLKMVVSQGEKIGDMIWGKGVEITS